MLALQEIVMSERPDPEGQRAVIMEMVNGLAESLVPGDVPVEAEHRIVAIQHALNYALGLPPQ